MKYTYIHYPTKDGKVLLFVTNPGYYSGDSSKKDFVEKETIVKAIVYKPEPVEIILFSTENVVDEPYLAKNQLLRGPTYFNVPLCKGKEVYEELNELEREVIGLVLNKTFCTIHYYPLKILPERFVVESLIGK